MKYLLAILPLALGGAALLPAAQPAPPTVPFTVVTTNTITRLAVDVKTPSFGSTNSVIRVSAQGSTSKGRTTQTGVTLSEVVRVRYDIDVTRAEVAAFAGVPESQYFDLPYGVITGAVYQIAFQKLGASLAD